MKAVLGGLVIGLAVASAAQAQHALPGGHEAHTPPPKVEASPATAGRLSIDSTFLQLATDPRTAAVMKKRMPGIVERLMEDEEVRAMMGGITVREMSIDQDHGKALTPQVLAMLDAEFAAAQQAAPPPAAAPSAAAASEPRTVNLQGNAASNKAFIDNPYWHAFYDLSKKTLADGPAKVDMAAYQKQSMDIFAAFAKSMNMSVPAMQDHLKLIPGQVVQIAKEDPHILDSFENFVLAMMGPD